MKIRHGSPHLKNLGTYTNSNSLETVQLISMICQSKFEKMYWPTYAKPQVSIGFLKRPTHECSLYLPYICVCVSLCARACTVHIDRVYVLCMYHFPKVRAWIKKRVLPSNHKQKLRNKGIVSKSTRYMVRMWGGWR